MQFLGDKFESQDYRRRALMNLVKAYIMMPIFFIGIYFALFSVIDAYRLKEKNPASVLYVVCIAVSSLAFVITAAFYLLVFTGNFPFD